MLNAHPVVYTLLHGDKDTYRLAWEFAGLPYYQIPQPPLALGGIGPQEMVDGSTAMATSGPGGFCGQALLQRDEMGDALFVHRVLSKYNLMNLLTVESWGWVAPRVGADPRAEGSGRSEGSEGSSESGGIEGGVAGEAGLIQRDWCIEVVDDAGHAPAMSPPSVLALAKRAVEARMDMVDHF